MEKKLGVVHGPGPWGGPRSMFCIRPSKSPPSKSPPSAVFAPTCNTRGDDIESAVSVFWFCREVIPFGRKGIWFCRESNIRFSSELFAFDCVYRFCLESKIWFGRELFDFAVIYLISP